MYTHNTQSYVIIFTISVEWIVVKRLETYSSENESSKVWADLLIMDYILQPCYHDNHKDNVSIEK